ncbi:pentatricopeptide repeat-containing protein At4g14820-like [Dioscorea cayenensis subsp. rotundata]|uniref:Pentatricopeptide repeat-containing protein At4g14820-like n=1 Tax=Dioscorea cayennensis subsp. rotundata TaxID=55577 RepID=A0AB40AJU0_DIOCR|nr:pentatricopeptide repeat-containing protein At4g14820-like [Dioscorea cayenensis subsp. rotundata]
MNKTSNIVALLKQCSNSTRLLQQIHAQTTINGLLLQTETLIWNSVIRAYGQSPSPIHAILIYNYFIHLGSQLPDNYTYPALLKACSHLPYSLPKAREVHGHATKLGFVSDVYIQNSLIHVYGVLSQIDDARKLFDEMPHRDLTSWNSILTAYVCTCDLRTEVFVLFREMVRHDVCFDGITLAVVLSGCGILGCGRVIHAYALKHGLAFDVRVGNSIMDAYAKTGDLDAAFGVFEEMGVMGWSDVVSHTILINACVESGSLEVARDIFDRMSSRDVVLWNSMIEGYIKAKRPKEGMELFKRMGMEMIVPDEKTMVSVVSACGSLADLNAGRLVHQFIHRQGIKEDKFVQTALVDMYAKCGSLEDALLVFLKMTHKDVFAWTVLISGFSTYGYGKDSFKLFSMMQCEGVEPNEATFVALLKACTNSGLVHEGHMWFKRMEQNYNIKPKIEHLGCMIDLLSRAGMLSEAEELIKCIPIQDRVVVYKTMLHSCICFSNIQLGERIAEELIKLDKPQSHGVYVLLSNFYAFARRWQDVEELREIARSSDMKKDAGISYIKVAA